MLLWHEERTPFSTLSRIGNMKFPGPSKTWEALLSDIPTPALTKYLLSREQAHQAPTGREERDFLSDKADFKTLPSHSQTEQSPFKPFPQKETERPINQINQKPEWGKSRAQSPNLNWAEQTQLLQEHLTWVIQRSLCSQPLSNFQLQIKKSYYFLSLTESK